MPTCAKLLAKPGAARPHAAFATSLLDRFGIARWSPAAFRAGAENLTASYLRTPATTGPVGRRAVLDASIWLRRRIHLQRLLLLGDPAGLTSCLLVRWLDDRGQRYRHRSPTR